MRALVFLLMIVVPGMTSATPALSIEPFKVQLVPQGFNKSQIFQFSNQNDEPGAVQLHIETWKIAKDGTEINENDDKSFSVYPSQFVMPARSTVAVRVTWLGEENPDTEHAFRLVAEQLPVDFDAQPVNGAVRFLLTYRAALYVTPPKAQPKIDVSAFAPIASASNTLVFTLSNTGNAHTLVKEPVATLTDSEGHTTVLREDKLRTLRGENVHAGSSREFEVAWPKALAGKTLKAVELEFTPRL